MISVGAGLGRQLLGNREVERVLVDLVGFENARLWEVIVAHRLNQLQEAMHRLLPSTHSSRARKLVNVGFGDT